MERTLRPQSIALDDVELDRLLENGLSDKIDTDYLSCR